jgi:hypothetical protein
MVNWTNGIEFFTFSSIAWCDLLLSGLCINPDIHHRHVFVFVFLNVLVVTLHWSSYLCLLQVGLFGVMLICAGTYIFPELRTPLSFCGLTVAVVLGFVVPFLHIVLQANPILWILQLLLANTPRVCYMHYMHKWMIFWQNMSSWYKVTYTVCGS